VTGVFATNPSVVDPGGYGLLRVTTQPALPSQILVDGSVADTWGLNWLKLGAGPHTVCFGEVAGFEAPTCQNVAVSNGVTTEATGVFTQLGTLRVTTSPAVSATIYVDNVGRNDWGFWSDLAFGNHTVCFGPVPDKVTPPCQTVALSAGSTTAVTGTFI
jgi:hypothetical protein